MLYDFGEDVMFSSFVSLGQLVRSFSHHYRRFSTGGISGVFVLALKKN
jgi:hypothetical protein